MIRYRTNVERRVLYGKATVVMMQNLSLLTDRGYDKLRCHQWRQSCNHDNFQFSVNGESLPDSKVHGANMGPTWVLSAPDGPHMGPMDLAIRAVFFLPWFCRPQYAGVSEDLLGSYNWWLSTLPSTLCNTSMGTTALAMALLQTECQGLFYREDANDAGWCLASVESVFSSLPVISPKSSKWEAMRFLWYPEMSNTKLLRNNYARDSCLVLPVKQSERTGKTY